MTTTLSTQSPRHRSKATAGILVNDQHSQLNQTKVHSVHSPANLTALCHLVKGARQKGQTISICGNRHAMGGQQFGENAVLIDTLSMNRVLGLDAENGIVEVEAGICWPQLQSYLDQTRRDHNWAIHQKQTGADRLTLGGALAANIHGRGLTKPPFVADIESFVLVDSNGDTLNCSRTKNAHLFSLAIGGFGLFGVVYSLKLKLVQRQKMRRDVRMVDAANLKDLFRQRIDQGFEFGDFQFVTDENSGEFLRRGIFACYEPVTRGRVSRSDASRVSDRQWQKLVELAHTNKRRAFKMYSRRYRKSHGRIYWSDELQYMKYVEGYHKKIDERRGCRRRHSEMITEIFVPRQAIGEFLLAARDDLRRLGGNLIYGTVRLVEPDTETFLSWARQPLACVIFNLCVQHSAFGIDNASRMFRQLIDRGLEFGGSYYLTYHRFARRDQVEKAHPRLGEFLQQKQRYDPGGLFRSSWFDHHREMLGA